MAFAPQVLEHADLLGGVVVRDPVRSSQAARGSVIRLFVGFCEAWSGFDRDLMGNQIALGVFREGPLRRAWHRDNSLTAMLRAEKGEWTPLTATPLSQRIRLL